LIPHCVCRLQAGSKAKCGNSAPLPPAGRSRTQKKRDMRRTRKDLREVIEAKHVGGSYPPNAKRKI